MPREFDPLFGKPPCPYTEEDCLPACEHGHTGPCERNRVPYDQDGWIDITHVGSVHEIQWNAITNAHRHRPLSLGPDARRDRRWVDREWIPGSPPGDKNGDDDDIDKRLEGTMLTLERTVQEVSVTVSEFRGSMIKLRRATQFLFWTFVVLGLCFLWAGWRNLP